LKITPNERPSANDQKKASLELQQKPAKEVKEHTKSANKNATVAITDSSKDQGPAKKAYEISK
jgi:hypothetical protein